MAFTVLVLPTVTAEVFDTTAPPDAVTVPLPPEATVDDTTVAVAESTKRTL